jgi:hypothetical protein
MKTNGFGGVEITRAVEHAQRAVRTSPIPGDVVAAATLLVLLDVRRLLDRIDTGTDLARDELKSLNSNIDALRSEVAE